MTDRIRGRKLQRIRRRHLMTNPLCVICEQRGRVTAATEIDHVVPLYKGGPDDDSNRQGLCRGCHEAKTRSDLGQRQRQAVGADGWPLSDDAGAPGMGSKV